MTVNVWAVVGTVVGNLPMESLLGTADQLLGMNNGATATQYKTVTFRNSTGQLAVPVGAVGTPSYTFAGDLNTGFYQDGADSIGIATNGVRRVGITAALISHYLATAMNGAQFREDKAVDIASGAAIDIGAALGNYAYITHAAGSVSISDLGGAAVPAGTCIETKFVITGGTLTLVHNAVSMILFGAANLVIGNGTIVRWRKINDASAYWEMVSLQPTSTPVQINAANYGFLPGAISSVNKVALQAAIDALGTTIGGEVLVPVGAYTCDAGITVPQANTTITGVGLGSGYARPEAGTTITFTATGGPVGFDLTAINGPGGAGNYSCLRNMSIKGNGVLGTGIKASGMVILEHLTVSGCITHGIYLFNLINQALLFDVASVENTGAIGLAIGDPTGATGGSNTAFDILHCTFRQNLTGIRVTNARHASFRNCISESNVNQGLVLYQYTGGRVEFLTFDSCWFEENYAGGAAGYSILIDAQTVGDPPDHIIFRQCNFQDTAPTDTMDILAVKWCRFEQCEFHATNDIRINAVNAHGVQFIDCQGGTFVGTGVAGRTEQYNSVEASVAFTGAVQLGDGSDALLLYTNNMKTLGSNYEIALPLQPCFLATAGGAQDNVTGDGTAYTVLFATEIFDQNADFASPTFTAPVAGRYRFNIGLFLDQLGAAHTTIIINLVASNRTLSIYRKVGTEGSTERCINGSVLVDMDAADTASVTVTVVGGTKVVDIPNNGQYTYFSGELAA